MLRCGPREILSAPALRRRATTSALLAAGLVIGTGLGLPGGLAAEEGPLQGTWIWADTGRERPPDGGDERFATEIVLEIHDDGGRLSGELRSPLLRLPLQGERRDRRIALVAGDLGSGLPFSGQLADDRLELQTRYPQRPDPLPVTLRRATRAEIEALPPLPIPRPLPALRALPDNGLARTPPMGWNSWNHFATEIDDATVRGVAHALVTSGMRDAGYVYVNIDDGWQGRRDAAGRLRPNERFPDMKALADYLHQRGLKLGLYSSPGPRTCAYYEGSFGHEAEDAQTFADWGVDYLKYDWCSARMLYRDDQMPQVYQKMAEALRRSGRDIVFSICQYGEAAVWKWGAAAGGNLWRTTGDIADDWQALSFIGFAQSALAPFAGPGHWNDPDMLEVGNGGMTADEYRTHMSLWALLAAPLLAGNDVRHASPATIALLTAPEVVAIDQDPLGRQGTRVSPPGRLEVWAKPLADGSFAVGLFNRGETAATVGVRWRELGWAGPARVRNAWERRDLGSHEEGYEAEVPRHGVALLVVAPEAARPSGPSESK